MAHLIDGNNLMGQSKGIDHTSPQARQQLLRRLAMFRQLPGRRPQRLTVVFDGAPEPNFPHGSAFQGIRLLYPEHGSTADEVIKEIVNHQQDKRALTVVTSDRSLYNYARSCGVQVLTCEQFNRRLDAALEETGLEEKGDVGLDGSDLEEWMRYFGVEQDPNSA